MKNETFYGGVIAAVTQLPGEFKAGFMWGMALLMNIWSHLSADGIMSFGSWLVSIIVSLVGCYYVYEKSLTLRQDRLSKKKKKDA
jgi:hypothetical protein